MTEDAPRPPGDAQPPAAGPALSVVVIAYNDAHRLPAAVASVREQTLTDLEVIVVDDASTDGSAAVADRLARSDQRVRAVHLPENSGGCSRPRNVGIDAARGRYVMFLDSDDVLPRDACRRLVEAATATGADFAAGRCVRVHLSEGGRVRQWYRWLYTEETYYSSVLENPDLLYDTLSTNKCYRREFLDEHALRFPEGYHYEDLLFSARAYVEARGIAIIPDVVYHWNVVEATDTPSISNRRSELRNFEDRIGILEMIDAEFARHGAVELKLAKDVKFLRHDLRLYLTDLPFRPDDYRRRFLEVAKRYLGTLDPRAFERAEPVQAIAAWLILRDDEVNLVGAIDYICHGRKLSTGLVERDEQVFWCRDHLDTAEGRDVLDVTELGFQRRDLPELDLYNRLTEVRVAGTHLVLAGEITNQLDRLPVGKPLRLQLQLRPRWRGRRPRTVDVTDFSHEPAAVRWRVEVDLRHAVRAIGFLDRVWDVQMKVCRGSESNVGRVSATDPAYNGRSVAVRPLLGRLAADALETLVTPDGDLALQFTPGTRLARSLHQRGQRAAHSTAARLLRAGVRRARALAQNPKHPRLVQAVFRQTLLRLPSRPRLVVFESAGGERFAGNPRAIYEELRRQHVDAEVVWAHLGSTAEFPVDARLVRHGSIAYYVALARAAAWVDDRGFPRPAVKRKGTFYLQTWSGTPIRRIGFDSHRMRQASGGRAVLRAQVARWDAVLARAPFDAEILTRAFRLRVPVLPFGYPRNDALVNGGDPAVVDAMRQRLGLGGRQVVLHLPSCRSAVLAPAPSVLAPGQALVVRTPLAWPRNRVDGVVDATEVDDLTTLLLLADVLVTDHHPALFELPLRDRPVVLVGCRCRLRNSRGDRDAYLDIDLEAPGPTVWRTDELASELADLEALRGRHREAMDRVVKEYGAYDTGTAASRAVELLLRRWDA